MPSIEEARAALITHLISHCGDEGHPKARCCEPLADAYAMAVLDGAHSHEGLYRCNCTTWAEGDRCREYRADRAKILALGKEGE